MFKALHLFFATLLLGINLISYFLLIHQRQNPTLSTLTLKVNLTIDRILLFVIGIVFISGTLLVPKYHLSFHTSWINAAYLFLSLATLLWLANYFIKRSIFLYGRSKLKSVSFHSVTLLIALLLILIIKDAVMQQTWLSL